MDTSSSSSTESSQPGQNARYARILIEFKRRFPKAIPADDKLPLKSGIHMDMIAAGAEPERVDLFLQMYAKNVGYLQAVIAGKPRVDLDGNPVSQITAAEKAYAEEMLNKRGENFDVEGNGHLAVEIHKGKTAIINMDEGLIEVLEAMHGQGWREVVKNLAPVVARQIPPEYDLSRAVRNHILRKAAELIQQAQA